MSEETFKSMNDQAIIKIEPPEYPVEDIERENEDKFDDLDAVVKSESCSEDDDTCLERFKNSEVTIEDEVKQESFDCDICNQSFAESHHLTKHMVDHMPNRSKERPYKCEICPKTFNQSRGLNTHMVIHSGERPHKCNECNKAFTRLGDLKRHMLIHSGERPHKCNECNKAFITVTRLKTHMLVHGGKRSHECMICKKTFTQSYNLRAHMFIHSAFDIRIQKIRAYELVDDVYTNIFETKSSGARIKELII
ncbi:zinc finger protein 99-like [Ctenocephalides felis]|uniref:zinc finger protein 99-like n=1 Tax=Ctenocephalides felis TaxID=7515 RepID=UPI000E6E3E1F|nr:zinc finger protein 99-like [Ctenocephalides felis]